ncbi:MAG: TIGR03086 family protein [Nonomuraea sp.]|nr:TIGR03086 family protein [Nonomuraea sp.]NUP64632.1 TIGR03086 family protein [Nonomuraea sp.]NUP78338.1 TIGR03086 family protein [Nonomuraea sp.]NUS06928.1 TIGR03086 family protein [Nonomuraea sp.]NUT44968.1 TIGR03086 family protein [Thermoactinospora sp.]
MNERMLALTAGVALLERAIDYTLGSLRVVSPSALCRATPCARWRLQDLLDHMHDSFEALNEAALGGIGVGVSPRPLAMAGPVGRNPALLLRDGATEVLGTWAGTITSDPISVGDRPMTTPMVAAVGAIEIAVHGWDIARACGERRPIPRLMAEELLDLARLFVTDEDRPFRFAAPVRVPAHAPTHDHLLAYLGRDPD